MNILMLTSVYPQPDDGCYKTTPTVKHFCEEWVKQGHRVIVVHNSSKFPFFLYYIPTFLKRIIENKTQIQFPPASSRLDIEREEFGVKIYRFNMLKIKPHASFSKNSLYRQANKIVSMLDKESMVPDYIIGHWANPQMALISILKQKYYSSATSAIVFHNDCYSSDVLRYSLLDYLRDIDAVGCRNSSFSKMVKHNLNLNYSPFICYSGIPNEKVIETRIDDLLNIKNQNSLLYVGRLVKYKKLDSVIKALNNCRSMSSFRLEVVGEGAEAKIYKDLVDNYSLSDKVCFISKLSRDEVFNHMAVSECFVLISENEVFGMVYFEAMLMGCITIASRGSIMEDVIIDGQNGFLCNAGDEMELTKILLKIRKKINNKK